MAPLGLVVTFRFFSGASFSFSCFLLMYQQYILCQGQAGEADDFLSHTLSFFFSLSLSQGSLLSKHALLSSIFIPVF